ncbi:MAG: transcriptional regulator [Planctomycetaceae bacterium]|nr:transcriptional regulator [Planctomycetaceae bacterium]
MKPKRRRSPCPIACTLDLVGDRWTLLVVRDLVLGKTHYNEFLASPERIATNILADRLEQLVAEGFVTTAPSNQRAGALAYSLTERGEALRPLLESIRDWGLAHVPGTEARLQPG